MLLKTLALGACSFLSATLLAQAEQIKANNSPLPLSITSTDVISITLSYPDSPSTTDYDWWVVVTTPLPAPNHMYYFDGSTWTLDLSVAYQQPLAATDDLEVLVVSGLPAGSYTFYFATDPNANGEIDLESLTYNSIDVVVAEAIPVTATSCGNSNQLFSVDPLEDDAYFQINPLGATSPSAHTFPTVHTYMMLTDNSQARNVYAPGNISVTNITFIENLTNGVGDYALGFSPCPEVTGYFDHMSSINQELTDLLVDFDSCQQYMAGTFEFRLCTKFVDIDFAAGTRLGTAGGPSGTQSAALDFGLRDSRITPLFYVNPERVINPDQLSVACPYDYFVPGSVQAGLMVKLGDVRSDLPLCGGVAYDIADTAQGRWYLRGTTDFGESDHIALVPSNKAPATIHVLSIGNAAIGTDGYFFDSEDSGKANRAFSDVSADGTVYCWDNLRNREKSLASGSSQAIAGIIFLQMTDDNSLTMQRSTQLTSCPADTGSLLFDGNAVQFVR